MRRCGWFRQLHRSRRAGTSTPSGILGPDAAGADNCRGTGTSGSGSSLHLDAPIVDLTAGQVCVFLGNDCGDNSVMIRFPTVVSSTSYQRCPVRTTVGAGSTTGIPLSRALSITSTTPRAAAQLATCMSAKHVGRRDALPGSNHIQCRSREQY